MNWTEVVRDNARVAFVLSVTATGIAFAIGGPIWGFFTLYICVFVALATLSYSRTMRTRAAAARAASARQNDVSVEFTRWNAKPDKELIDALAALSKSDTARVRAALEAWVKRAPDPDHRMGRQAQLHYRLYRAGDPTQLERLRALADANPNLAEVTLWQRLSTQDHDELWS